MKNFFYKLPSTLARCFWGRIIWLHLLAIVLTYLIVTSDFDWIYFSSTRSPLLQSLLFPAALIGGLLPFVLPFILYGIGTVKKHARTLNTGFALGQAAVLGWFVSSFYKAFTGRVPPGFRTAFASAGQTATDNSHGFQFGFWRGGIFWGWPSTHTTVAFAMAVTLFILYPENKLIKYGALIYALYIGVGISTNIHWFSEFIAGALIGTAIGIAVGKSFLKRSR